MYDWTQKNGLYYEGWYIILSRFLKVTKEQLTHLTALEGQKLSFTPTASLDTSKDSVQDCALSDSVNEVWQMLWLCTFI